MGPNAIRLLSYAMRSGAWCAFSSTAARDQYALRVLLSYDLVEVRYVGEGKDKRKEYRAKCGEAPKEATQADVYNRLVPEAVERCRQGFARDAWETLKTETPAHALPGVVMLVGAQLARCPEKDVENAFYAYVRSDVATLPTGGLA